MITVEQTEVFGKWLRKLRDATAKAKIFVRIDRLALGNPGDVRPVGDGVSEMRIDHGPGYRVYYKAKGGSYVLLLIGGDKSTQADDIETAKRLAKDY